MNIKHIIILSLSCLPALLPAQNAPSAEGLNERKFEIIVREDSTLDNTRGIIWEDNRQRLFGSELFSLYRSTVSSKFSSASTSIIGLGINFIYDKLASHRQDWMQAVQKECTYTKQLSMQTEIVDFYKKPSRKGAMDPENIVFNGFGCRQTIGGNSQEGNGSQGNNQSGKAQGNAPQGGSPAEGNADRNNRTDSVKPDASASKDVFYVFCKLRTDEVGKQRITNHSKFEVVVDSIYFNPYICNLPNDSAMDADSRIEFNFDSRNNLTFTLTANVTSSWMNEAIQIYRDVPLGEFRVTAKIDKEDLEKDSLGNTIFTYSSERDKNTTKAEKVSVTGDCFIVPRSYVGTVDGTAFTNAWGTGQYKIDMQVTESCSINRDYYLVKDDAQQEGTAGNVASKDTAGKENTGTKKKSKKKQEEWNDKWKEEWKIIKKRQKTSNLWNNVKDVIISQWTGKEWITTIIEPALSSIAQSGTNLLSGDSTNNNMQGQGGTGGAGTTGGGTPNVQM